MTEQEYAARYHEIMMRLEKRNKQKEIDEKKRKSNIFEKVRLRLKGN